MNYRIALIADNHFIKYNGNYFVNGTYTKQYLKRFTSNFDNVTIISRVTEAKQNEKIDKYRESGGERIEFCELDDFYGIKGFLLNRKKIKEKIKDTLKNVDMVIIRMPCILTNVSIKCAQELKLPFMLDVGADPDTIYRSIKPTISELILSKYMKYKCKRICLKANGVSYVTKEVLQKKYPCKAILKGESAEFFTASISNVDISKDFFYKERKYQSNNSIKLLHISNNIWLDSGKGHIESLYVLKKIISQGYNAQITYVGEARDKDKIIELAKSLEIDKNVFFTGRIGNRDEYKNVILKNDIFLFPSHSEGLPRVLVEVMATGMVCVASNVDGIPELLEKSDIFNYSDIDGMSKRIIELSIDKDSLDRISQRNYNVSLEYSNDNLKKKYDDYYGKARNLIKLKNKNGGKM